MFPRACQPADRECPFRPTRNAAEAGRVVPARGRGRPARPVSGRAAAPIPRVPVRRRSRRFMVALLDGGRAGTSARGPTVSKGSREKPFTAQRRIGNDSARPARRCGMKPVFPPRSRAAPVHQPHSPPPTIMSKEKIAFVGVGRMGANMARRLKDCGYEITAVYDANATGRPGTGHRTRVPPPPTRSPR